MDGSGERRLQALVAAAAETLENLAFTEVAPGEAGGTAAGGLPERRARIRLDDGTTLGIALDAGLLDELAAIVHSLDGKPDRSVSQDTLLEILNIVAGRFEAGLRGGQGDFSLGLPEPMPAADASWERAISRCSLVSEGEGARSMFLWIY